jgi:hypothetical protein
MKKKLQEGSVEIPCCMETMTRRNSRNNSKPPSWPGGTKGNPQQRSKRMLQPKQRLKR